VVDPDHTHRGVVRDAAALESAQRGDKSIRGIIEPGIRPVAPDAALRDLVPVLAQTPMPAPVVDERGRLLGVVVRASLLRGLATGAANNGFAPTEEAA
jgi:glycine betaine/proline transport system ATP-binding protein